MNKTKTQMALLALLLFILTLPATAQDFDTYFCDSTLRIDYVFAGNAKEQGIYVDELNLLPRWYGKRHRLAEVPIAGNGQIIVKACATGQVVYRNSFSTLFQEWLTYDESIQGTKSRDTVDVSIELYDNRREVMATMTHRVTTSDILIHRRGFQDITPYVTLQQAQDPARCIHIAYLAEGYQEQEMETFLEDARIAMEAMFAHEPFKSLRDRFHIIAVKSPSVDSGTSIPRKGVWKDTALHSHFDTFYSDRYLTTLQLKDLHNWLAGTPYEHIIVLVNTSEYGGGGILNSYNLAMAHHPKFKPVVVHEFGHSFAGLGDEYAYESEQIPMYPPDVEPWEPNLTTLTDFKSKWQDMMEEGKIGLYEGAGYAQKGVYRACEDCRMRTNENPSFCPVCDRAIRRLINFYTQW